jgi:hypothetical protein
MLAALLVPQNYNVWKVGGWAAPSLETTVHTNFHKNPTTDAKVIRENQNYDTKTIYLMGGDQGDDITNIC